MTGNRYEDLPYAGFDSFVATLAAEDSDETVRATFALGLHAEPTAEVEAVLLALTHAQEPSLQRAAVLAINYLGVRAPLHHPAVVRSRLTDLSENGKVRDEVIEVLLDLEQLHRI